MMIDLLTAQKAREISADVNISKRCVLMNKISEAIDKASKDGRYFVMVSAEEDESVIKELQDMGYEVKWTTNQKNGDDYRIKWGK